MMWLKCAVYSWLGFKCSKHLFSPGHAWLLGGAPKGATGRGILVNLLGDPHSKPPLTPQNIRHILPCFGNTSKYTFLISEPAETVTYIDWASRLQSFMESLRSRRKTQLWGRASSADQITSHSTASQPLPHRTCCRKPEIPDSCIMHDAHHQDGRSFCRCKSTLCLLRPPRAPLYMQQPLNLNCLPLTERVVLTTQGKPPALWLLYIAH